MKKISVVIALVIVLSSFSFLSAEEEYLDPYPFSGHLLDSNGNPLVGYEIVLTNQRTGDTLSMLSAKKGEFTFTLNNFKNKIPYEKGDSITVTVDNKEAIMIIEGQYTMKDIVIGADSLSLRERIAVEKNVQINTKSRYSGSIVLICAAVLLVFFIMRRKRNG